MIRRFTGYYKLTLEERRARAAKQMCDLLRTLRPDQTARVTAHEPEEFPDGRLYTVEVEPWP